MSSCCWPEVWLNRLRFARLVGAAQVHGLSMLPEAFRGRVDIAALSFIRRAKEGLPLLEGWGAPASTLDNPKFWYKVAAWLGSGCDLNVIAELLPPAMKRNPAIWAEFCNNELLHVYDVREFVRMAEERPEFGIIMLHKCRHRRLKIHTRWLPRPVLYPRRGRCVDRRYWLQLFRHTFGSNFEVEVLANLPKAVRGCLGGRLWGRHDIPQQRAAWFIWLWSSQLSLRSSGTVIASLFRLKHKATCIQDMDRTPGCGCHLSIVALWGDGLLARSTEVPMKARCKRHDVV